MERKTGGGADRPATYEVMVSRYPTDPAGLNTCGPDAKPAEDAPKDEDDRLPTAVTATKTSYPLWLHFAQTKAPAASGRKEQPVCQDVVDAPIKAATADTASAAEEAHPPAPDEAQAEQPPEKWVSVVKRPQQLSKDQWRPLFEKNAFMGGRRVRKSTSLPYIRKYDQVWNWTYPHVHQEAAVAVRAG